MSHTCRSTRSNITRMCPLVASLICIPFAISESRGVPADQNASVSPSITSQVRDALGALAAKAVALDSPEVKRARKELFKVLTTVPEFQDIIIAYQTRTRPATANGIFVGKASKNLNEALSKLKAQSVTSDWRKSLPRWSYDQFVADAASLILPIQESINVIANLPEPVSFAKPKPVTLAEPEPVTLAEPEPVTLAEDGEPLQRAAAGRAVEDKVPRPDVVLPLGSATVTGVLADPQTASFSLLSRHFQSFLAPEPPDSLGVRSPPFAP
jgi:hypothetical protein